MTMKTPTIIIEAKGGIIQFISTNIEELKIVIIDHDYNEDIQPEQEKEYVDQNINILQADMTADIEYIIQMEDNPNLKERLTDLFLKQEHTNP